MIGRIVFALLFCSYLAVIVPFTRAVSDRPVAIKLGVMPEAELLKVLAGEHRHLVAQYAVVKVLFYYGTLVEKFQQKVRLTPEYRNMYATLQTSSKLDPYNADVYYFTQAAFTWELNRIYEVNEMLDYGMRYRTWDYQLPFFAGFNCAYFKKDYAAAAVYFKKAAELSGKPLMANLSARYFSETGQHELGLRFIEYMQHRTMDRKLLAVYETRKQALTAALTIQNAVGEFNRRFGKRPARVPELVEKGVLVTIPRDPYGGEFYLDDKGVVRSTSKFAFSTLSKKQNDAPRKQEK